MSREVGKWGSVEVEAEAKAKVEEVDQLRCLSDILVG